MIASLLSRVRHLAQDDVARSLTGKGLITLMIKVASAGLTYAMLVLFAQAMSIPEFGKFSFGFNLATLLAVLASLGAQVGITRWWPEYVARGDIALASSSLRWGLAVTLGGAAVVTALMLLGGFVTTLLLDAKFSFLMVAAALVAPLAVADYFANALRAQGNVVLSQVPKDIVWRLACCIAALAAIFWHASFDARTAFWVASLLLALLVAYQFLYLRSRLPRALLESGADMRDIHGAWRRILGPLWGAAILHAMIQYIDVVLVGLFMSPTAAGPYFAVARTAGLISLMSIASTMVCAPLVSKYVHGGETAELQRLLRIMAVVIALPTLIAYLMLILFGGWLLRLFDPSFEIGYVPLIILGFGYTVHALSGSVGYTLMLTGHESIYLRIMTISYAGILVFQLIAIPTFGMLGAAAGAALGMVITNLWARRIAVARVGVDSTILSVFMRRRDRPTTE